MVLFHDQISTCRKNVKFREETVDLLRERVPGRVFGVPSTGTCARKSIVISENVCLCLHDTIWNGQQTKDIALSIQPSLGFQ